MAVQVNRKRFSSREAYLETPRYPIVVVAYNADDPNIAGMLRSAEAFMTERVFMIEKPKKFAAAVGAAKWQPTTYWPTLTQTIKDYKAAGYVVVGLELTDESVPLWDAVMPTRMVLVVGNESHGIPQDALDLCDTLVEIPQFGFGQCLNVVVAASIALYEWSRQHCMVEVIP